MGFLSKYDEPPGRFVFHNTSSSDVESILEEGVLRTKSRYGTSKDIDEVLKELDYENPFPFDRKNAAYCHVDRAYVEEIYRTLQGSGFAHDDVILVVDVDEIDAPMYLADMGLISDLIDYRHASADVMLYSNSPNEAVRGYQKSIVEVDGAEEIASQPGPERNHTELVVDGDIPPAAVVDVFQQLER